MIKKIIAVIILVSIITLSFSSCASTDLELKNRVIVEAIGIDKAENGVKITMQFLNTDQSSNPNNGGTPEEIVKNVSVESANVSSALKSLTKIIGKIPMMSQNRVILFGSELAKSGVSSSLDYFIRNPDNRATVIAAVTENTAEEILTAKMGEGVIPAKEIGNVLSSSKYNSLTATRAFYQFVNSVKSDTASAYLPVLNLKESKTSQEEKEPEVIGAAIFHGDMMKEKLPQKNIPALLWLTDDYQKGTLTVRLEGGDSVSLIVVKSKTKIKTTVKDNIPNFEINIDCAADCIESSELSDELFSKSKVNEIKKGSAEIIADEIDEILKKCFVEYNSDPFCFGNRVWRADKEFYRANTDNWADVLPTAQYTVNVNVDVRRIGDENIIPDVDMSS